MRTFLFATIIALSTLTGGSAWAHGSSQPVVSPQVLEQLYAAPELNGTVNINTADQKTLELLPGVGPSTAKKIISYRQKHKGFKETIHLMRIKGIGRKTFNALKPFVTVKGDTTLSAPRSGKRK